MRFVPPEPKPVFWIVSSKKDLLDFPATVRQNVGYALDFVQRGETPGGVTPLQGFGGTSVMEIRENYQTDTYRAVYTARFDQAVYVLHCFQKKSHRGIATSPQDIALIRQRFAVAEEHYRQHFGHKPK